MNSGEAGPQFHNTYLTMTEDSPNRIPIANESSSGRIKVQINSKRISPLGKIFPIMSFISHLVTHLCPGH